ncbi:hypothetical protein QNI19_14655 [Cytophagaceae bacterium DM2B3-1]|uniref:Morphogenetic protein n=1 Tax=Xanthocytophaga flava TaxID=3048013 RepID=A0ABT7CKW8_9BACT|nr:hypothetical protein [Xanthocytophaga flavus]MDJ1494181.1 hypothetical protein [Xanthocytophaga flavus]
MKELSILFSTEMVQAILEGRKTQTRRILKPQPSPDPARISFYGGKFGWMPESNSGKVGIFNPYGYKAKYGQKGDILWVKEAMYMDANDNWNYKADNTPFMFSLFASDEKIKEVHEWVNSRKLKSYGGMYMPKFAARIWLKITDIRLERFQSITEQDAIAEGVQVMPVYDATTKQDQVRYRDYRKAEDNPKGRLFHSAKYSYFTLWDKINGRGQHLQNPWVWVITFERFYK